MLRTKLLLIILVFWSCSQLLAQTKTISGKVTASNDVFGVHIMNKTASKFTITDDEGRFEIPARLYDTIMVSAIQYKPVEYVVTDIIMQSQQMNIYLDDNVNELDQVVVGKVLTGDLMTDIENSDAKRDINFYDLGIPGYTGRRKTLSERRLYEASTGGGIVPLNPFLNWISGRTKQLKEQIKREEKDKSLDVIIENYSEMLFENETLDVSKRREFFYFCADDSRFMSLSRGKNDLIMLEFLREKLKAYKIQSETD